MFQPSKNKLRIFFKLILILLISVLLSDLVFSLVYIASGYNFKYLNGIAALVIFILWARKIIK